MGSGPAGQVMAFLSTDAANMQSIMQYASVPGTYGTYVSRSSRLAENAHGVERCRGVYVVDL
ncbi:hypothetical protein VMCG_03452 [Cytospora schulzeri]|uniref:Uncharacterized protein n=1 Tax=Cytospora schulzeri TaxID=448051 RepID=A0A423WW97_9PEZI|nr:hypothetical protein VMCG_03452 [Valsa malicola]